MVVVALLVGLLANVAVAWGLAGFRAYGLGARQDVFAKRLRDPSAGEGQGELMAVFFGAFGLQIVETVAREAYYQDPRSLAPESIVPAWARLATLPWIFDGKAWPVEQERRAARGSGWPMIALYHEYKWKPQQIGPPVAPFGEYLTPGGIRIRASMGNPGAWPVDYPPTLPYRPVWLGLAANTAFYAAIWLVLCFAVSSVRRLLRKRAGLCPGCAYSRVGLADDAVCPECGSAKLASAR